MDRKGSWLDKYATQVDELQELGISTSFEKIEQKVEIRHGKKQHRKGLIEQDDVSKIVDTLDLSNHKPLQFERYITEQNSTTDQNQVLTNDFLNEIGIKPSLPVPA